MTDQTPATEAGRPIHSAEDGWQPTHATNAADSLCRWADQHGMTGAEKGHIHYAVVDIEREIEERLMTDRWTR